jgi:DNA-binding beta-propeller fold protein YncE
MSKPVTLIFVLFFLLSCRPTSDFPETEPRENVAYIVTGAAKTIEVIDLDSFSIVNSYDISTSSERFPHHIYLSNDQKRLAVANPAYDFSLGHLGLHGINVPGGILIVNAATGALEKNIPVDYANHNVTFSKDDQSLITTGFSHSGRAYIFDANDGELKAEIILSPDPSEIIVTPDGNYAAVTSGESSFLQILNLGTQKMERQIKVDLAPSNVWPGYDNVLLVSNAFRKSVNFVGLEQFSVTDYIDFSFTPGYLTFNPDSKELWVCDTDNEAVRVFEKREEWTETASISFLGKEPHMIKFFDDYQKAILINQKGNTAVEIDVASKKVLNEIQVGEAPNGIAVAE